MQNKLQIFDVDLFFKLSSYKRTSSVQLGPLTSWVVGGGKGGGEVMMDSSTEILFQSFLQKAVVSSSSFGRNVHSLTLPVQHFLCRPRRRSLSEVP